MTERRQRPDPLATAAQGAVIATPNPQERSPRWRFASSADVVAAGVILLATALLARGASNLALLGWDSYPIIVASRIQSLHDLLGTFTERLMDGRYEGEFYRPVLNLSFALDYAVWRLNPFGYQLTNVLMLACCAAGLHLLTRRLLGPAGAVGGVITVCVFLLHPALAKVLPVPPRRPEMMACLFMALSLWTQIDPRRLAMKRPPIVPALFGLLAMGSKETALLLPALSALIMLLRSPRVGMRARVVHAAVAMIPHAVVLAAMIGVRFALFGGMGGHEETSVDSITERASQTFVSLALGLLFPQGFSLVAGVAAAAVGLGGVLMIGDALRPRAGVEATAATEPEARRLACAAVLAIAWMMLIALAVSASGRFESWYVLIPSAGLALLMGVVGQWCWSALRRGAAGPKATGVIVGVALAGMIAGFARYSPVVFPDDEWQVGSAASREFLAELHAQISAAPDGSVVDAPRVPKWAPRWAQRPSGRGVAILWDYSIQAWAELVFPQRKVRVMVQWRGLSRSPAADEVLVVLTRVREGFSGK